MNKEELYETIEGIDGKFIDEAERVQLKKKHPVWVKWTAVAACFCLIAVGVMQLNLFHSGDTAVQQWSQSITAKDYFKNSQKGNSQNSSSSASLVMPPYAVAVSIDDERAELENAGILPVLPEYSEQRFGAAYNGDGSLYKVSFLWMRRDENGLDGYSDLQFVASPEEIHEISDIVMVQVDDNGQTIAENVTVTERDGILIYAKGRENEQKTISWQTRNNWYQIIGSWNDSYDDMVWLLDWFWEHPLNLESFKKTDGIMEFSDRSEYPEAFSGMIPDFSSLGYVVETEKVSLDVHDSTLIPVWFEGIYTKGTVRVRWMVSDGADANAWATCVGRPNEISEGAINEVLSKEQSINIFFDSPCMATLTIESGTSLDAWEIIQSLQN